MTPFNFPLNLVAHKVAPALAAGNTVVLKPADKTPLTAVMLAEILSDAGLPPGVLEHRARRRRDDGRGAGAPPGAGQGVVHRQSAVGERIPAWPGSSASTLELGNNSGLVVEPDADLARASRCVMSAFANAGQVCLSLQRLYVQSSIADAFIEHFVAADRALKVGNPLDRDCDVGPMIRDDAAERVEAVGSGGEARRASARAGGRRRAAGLAHRADQRDPR